MNSLVKELRNEEGLFVRLGFLIHHKITGLLYFRACSEKERSLLPISTSISDKCTKPFYSLAGLLYKDKVARVALTCDSLVEEQNTYSHKRRKPSRKTRLSDKWRMAGTPSSGLRATRTLLIEGRTQSFKCKKALLFLAGLLYKWRSGRDSNPRPPA